MKNAIIFHGTESKTTDFWYQWLKDELDKVGIKTQLPYYPNINHVSIKEFLPAVLESHEFNSETILIGHSAGAPLILSILENISQKIDKAILVAGFSEPLPGPKDPILQDSYDWKSIRERANTFVIFNSDNDPWHCDDKQGRKLYDKLGGTLIIRHDGHFGSATHNQPYKEFPLLKDMVLEEKL